MLFNASYTLTNLISRYHTTSFLSTTFKIWCYRLNNADNSKFRTITGRTEERLILLSIAQCGNFKDLLSPFSRKNSVKSTDLVINDTASCFHRIFFKREKNFRSSTLWREWNKKSKWYWYCTTLASYLLLCKKDWHGSGITSNTERLKKVKKVVCVPFG